MFCLRPREGSSVECYPVVPKPDLGTQGFSVVLAACGFPGLFYVIKKIFFIKVQLIYNVAPNFMSFLEPMCDGSFSCQLD